MKWNKFGEIRTSRELKKYFNGREYTHSSYCHYTSLQVINSILENKQIRLSSVKCFNDKMDSQNFPQQDIFYSICFATGVNENLPLWYMYSGINGRGGRINFTKAQIKKLISNATYSLWRIDENKKLLEKVMDLDVGKTLSVTFKDVLYYTENNGWYDLKYNTMTNHSFNKTEFERYQKDSKPFTKSIVWYYEKESRIVAELINKAATAVDDGKNYCINMTIESSLFKKFKIELAPEIKENEVYEEISKFLEIKEYLLKTSKVTPSKYSGSIEMNLCKKCKYASEK